MQKFRLAKIATHAKRHNLKKLCNGPGRHRAGLFAWRVPWAGNRAPSFAGSGDHRVRGRDPLFRPCCAACSAPVIFGRFVDFTGFSGYFCVFSPPLQGFTGTAGWSRQAQGAGIGAPLY